MTLRADVIRRIARRLRRLLVRTQYSLGLPTLRPGPVQVAAGFRHPIAVSGRSALVERYRSLFPDSVEAELEVAELLLQHRFSMLGHDTSFGARIAWSRDPVSGRDWDPGFSPDIAYRGPGRLGDVKIPWELGKHQYFFTLGKAAWLTGDKRFADEIVRQIEDWIENNPCHRGIHWISALEAGARAVSWIVAYPFFSELCSDLQHTRMLQALGQHLLFIEQNLSIARYTNTHLAGEAAALLIGGMFLDCRHSARWRRKGRLLLEAEARRQVRPDGVHVEQSVAYHRFFLDQYYLVDSMLTANADQLSAETGRVIESMTAFLMDVLFPDGNAPAFGDCDDARGIWCRADCTRDFRALLSLGAMRFGRPDFKAVSGGPAEELLWLYGEQGLDRFLAIPSEPPDHTSAAYPHAGYYIMRSGWSSRDAVLVFDCGPLGHGEAGHGHADALSLQLHANGQTFLIDSGTYSYNLDYEWRQAFRSTRAHSTINVDGLDQSVARDRMSWEVAARATENHWISTPLFDLVDGTHDGYRRLADPVLHRRIVVFLKPDIWVVYDHLDCKGTHEFEMLFHVCPDCTIVRDGNNPGLALRAPTGNELHFCPLHAAPCLEQLDVLEPDGPARVPFFSAQYGRKQPGHAIRAQCTGSGPIALLTGFLARDDKQLTAAVEHGLLVRWLDKQGSTGCFYYCTDVQARVQQDDLTFEARVLYRDSGGAHSKTVLHARDCSHLEIPGLLRIESEAPVESIEIRAERVMITTRGNQQELTLSARPEMRISIDGKPLSRENAD